MRPDALNNYLNSQTMARNAILDRLICVFNKKNPFTETVKELNAIKDECEKEFILDFNAKVKQGTDGRVVFVDNFAALQFPKRERLRSHNHYPIR